MEYYYLGDSIDPSLAAKIEIPKERKDEFLSNEVFQKGRNALPQIKVGKGKKWWRLEGLKSRLDRTQILPGACFLECSLGEEDGKLVLYLSWSTS